MIYLHRNLGMDLPSGIRNLGCFCLLVVMGVVLPSILSVLLIAKLAVLLVCDAFGDLASLVWDPVVKEPYGSCSIFEVYMRFGSHRQRHCLTLEWLTLTPGHIVVAPPLLCCAILRFRRNVNIH